MREEAVSDTGPTLHLTEIGAVNSLNIFSKILIPSEVEKELKRKNTKLISKIKIINLKSEFKDHIRKLVDQYDLDLGEAESISLTIQEKADYFLTDDLEARNIAKSLNIRVHGSVGIILRSFREKIIDKKRTIEKIKELKLKSSLFITQDLINEVIKEVNEFR